MLRGSLILESSDGDYLSQFTYNVYEKGQIVEIIVRIDTFLNEGIGFGSALFHLGQTMIEKIALKYSGKTVVAFLVARSKKRNSLEKNEWTSTIARDYGYSNFGNLHEENHYEENADVFLKKL